MKILVTGANGFVGRNVVSYLSNRTHHLIYVATRETLPTLRYIDAVVHCAAAAGPWHSTLDIVRDNINYTNYLLESLDTRKFIFISSVMATGDSTYGMSKLICERLIEDSKIPAISLRCPGIVGPNCTGRNWAARTMREIKADKEVVLYNVGGKFNSVLHVEDLARTINCLVDQDFTEHTVVTLTAKNPIPVGIAAQALAKGLGKLEYKHRIVSCDAPVAVYDDESHRLNLDFELHTVVQTMCQFGLESRNEQN